MVRLPISVLPVLALALATSAAAQNFRLDFQNGVGAWQTVLDGVMGGRSSGRVSQAEPGTLRFFGELSLENNGGFSQMRRAVDQGALAGATGLLLEVKGDGRTYKFDIRQSTVRMMAGAYQRDFPTKKGEWTKVRLPLDEFALYSFGRKVRRAPQLDPAKIESIGITLADKKPGKFELLVRSISTYDNDAGGDGGAASSSDGEGLAAVAKAAGLNTLLKLVKVADLELPKTPITVLAPTDAAFDALPEETVRALLTPEMRPALRAILQHHVLPVARASGDLLNRRSLTSAIGQQLAVDDIGQTIGKAGIVATDVAFDGGIVHVIDKVLLPEQRSIAQIAVATDQLSTLVTAAKAAGLVGQLGPDNGPWTVFAPVDSAFAKLPKGTLDSLLARGNRDTLTSILGLHVVPGRIAARDLLAKKQVTTLMGAPIKVELQNRKLRVGGAGIVASDIQAANGVIHLIDSVITEPVGGRDRGRTGRGLEPRERSPIDVTTAAMGLYELAIARGATMWNAGNREGCTAVYELTVSSMLALAGDRLPGDVLRTLIRARDRAADQNAIQAAWTYREALDATYRQLQLGGARQADRSEGDVDEGQDQR